MDTITKHNHWRGKESLDDGEWCTFVDPGALPEFFEQMTDIIKVKFLGKKLGKGSMDCPQ